MKIVLDANLFASSLIKPDSVPGKVLDLVKQNQVENAQRAHSPLLVGAKRKSRLAGQSRFQRD